MEIIVAGAGQVGHSIATEISSDHTVTVIDRQGEQLDQVPYEVEAVHGNASDLDVLSEAGVESADMLITCTSDDRTNILTCSTARTIANPFTIARVSASSYLETWENSRKAFGVDRMVGRSKLTAEAIMEKIGFQTRKTAPRDVKYFGDGRIQMAEYDVGDSSLIEGKTVRETDQFPGLTFGAILRDGEIHFPDGSSEIREDDRIVVIGIPSSVQEFGMQVQPFQHERNLEDIVIAGGGEIGYQITDLLEEQDKKTRLIEPNRERAQFLSENLSNTIVLEGSALDRSLWNQERLHRSDLLIVSIRPDERGLLVSLIGKQMGIDQVICTVHNQNYLQVFESSDVDFSIHPREVVSDEITRYVLESYAENVTDIEHHQGELFEIEITEESSHIGIPLRKWRSEFPDHMVIGAILREKDVVVPRGDTELQEHDRVVILSDPEVAEEIANTL